MAGADIDVGTELRLGLPGGGAEAAKAGKRGFEDTVDLKLNLPTAGKPGPAAEKVKRPAEAAANDPEKPPAPKAQAVGWPPVRSYRRNIMTVQSVKNKKEEESDKQPPAANAGGTGSAFVKVSMDGAPYLRKVDLKMYNSYKDLSIALQKMFSTFTTTGISLSISNWSWSNVQLKENSSLQAVELSQYFQDNGRPEKQHIDNLHELDNPAQPITASVQ